MNNREKYPECWAFFEKHARNIENEPDLVHLGKYRIPKPDGSGDFIYAEHPLELFLSLKEEWYKPKLNSPSVYGKIQYIVNNL